MRAAPARRRGQTSAPQRSILESMVVAWIAYGLGLMISGLRAYREAAD